MRIVINRQILVQRSLWSSSVSLNEGLGKRYAVLNRQITIIARAYAPNSESHLWSSWKLFCLENKEQLVRLDATTPIKELFGFPGQALNIGHSKKTFKRLTAPLPFTI